jgi:hypothetical protein
MSAVMLVGLFVIRALGGAASTLVGEGPEGDDDRDLHRLQDFAERNQIPYRTVLRSHRSAWTDLAETCALPEAGTAVVTGERR